MPAWVSTALRPAPVNRTVTVRFGSNIFSAGFSKWRGWVMLEPGGGETEITEPPLWFDHDAPDISPEEERILVFGQECTSARRTHGPVQLGLALASPDSGKQSRTRTEAATR